MTEQSGDASVAETTSPDVVHAQDGSEFSSRGQTLVKAAHGYAFATSDKNLPIITPEGVRMSKTQAEAVVAEAEANNAEDLVFIAEEED